MGNIITPVLPHDLPENWNDTQYVSPGGIEVGLTEKHGYNYLMKQVNNSQKAINELDAELEDIDTTLQNKAPAGYGLGLDGPPSTNDCNTATKNGWYHVYGATLNKPFGKVGALLVVCREATQMYQLFFVGETYSTGGSCIIVRSMYGGEWGPWEWVNPPMQLGVESVSYTHLTLPTKA